MKIVAISLFVFLVLTTPTSAQGLAQLAGCSGPDCGTCEIIKLANGLIMWLIGFVTLLFALLLMRAGISLVTSGGNPGALQNAKDSFINALVGFIIILAAWLIVDTIMRALIGDERSGALVWSEIECTAQVSPQAADVVYATLEGTTDSLLGVTDVQSWAQTELGVDTSNLGTGNTAIVAFAELMKSRNCVYSQDRRNGCVGNPGYTDCSDLVNISYQAAGCRSPGTYTGNMIGSAKPYGSNAELRAGDALIHRSDGAGHVVICRDNGCSSVIHAAGTGRGIRIDNGASYYNDPRYKSTGAIRAADFCG